MDRDAPAPFPPGELIPPPPPKTVHTVGFVGLGMAGAAAALGLAAAAAGADGPGALSTVRLALVGVGAVVAGYAVSMRGGLWSGWAIAAAAAALGYVGTPPHWDSLRFLLAVLGGAAAAGAVLARLPLRVRYAVVSAAVVFHFAGIFTATTSPPPTPWVTEQSFFRVYLPYLQFLYLRNAYHFYSPDPGPASLLCFLVKTEAADQPADPTAPRKYDARWVALPRRPDDLTDPLSLGYYRRLSVTEQVARSVPESALPLMFEREEVRQRRRTASYLADPATGAREVIPLHPVDPEPTQYRLPHPDISRYLLPSYARHAILNYVAGDDQRRTARVMIYRLEHRILSAQEFRGQYGPDGQRGPPASPYSPITYRPYFLGEYDVYGKLVDPQEPMLYWVLPVFRKAAVEGKDDYEDYMSRHAGLKFEWSWLR